MTLRQDCELWATFDSEDVDSNRGIVRDRSGKGRTLSASGGPTYGQSSPVGEAVGFDGTDDEFVVLKGDDITSTNKRTAVAIMKWDGGNVGADKVAYTLGGSFTLGFRHTPADIWRAEATDAAGNFDLVRWFPKENEYVRMLVEWDSGTLRFINLSGPTAIGSISFSQPTLKNKDPLVRRVGKGAFSGEAAFIAEWSRALSDSEIEELTRMTDRMVSKL